MTLLLHPTGNNFVRETLKGLDENDLLDAFYTSLGVSKRAMIPFWLKKILGRRVYDIPDEKLITHPNEEIFRLLLQKVRLYSLLKNISSLSVDAISTHISQRGARYLDTYANKRNIKSVYAYEDSAYYLFKKAKELDISCLYELPIAYWKHLHVLLNEEMERLPEWKNTLVFNNDSEDKLRRKDQELDLADIVFCPSQFVYDSLPDSIKAKKRCVVNEYGAPVLDKQTEGVELNQKSKKLKVLFVGSMSQRKGLYDVLKAFSILKSNQIELTIVGTPLMPLSFYKSIYPDFNHIYTCSNNKVLDIMQMSDVFILPSIVEGRALVQLEALASGLPLIITNNTGGSDLIDEGKTGFLIPIRSPESIVEKIEWFIKNKDILPEMKIAAIEKAKETSWEHFRANIVNIIKDIEK